MINNHFLKMCHEITKKTKGITDEQYDFLNSCFGAKMYMDRFRDNINRALQYKHEHGIWTNKAPIGYINYRDRKGKAKIKVDPNIAYKIYKLFIVRKYGLSLSQLEKYVASLGDIRRPKSKPFIFKKKQISRILHNPFYAGTMIIKGKAYPHNYPKIISKELFDEVQETFK